MTREIHEFEFPYPKDAVFRAVSGAVTSIKGFTVKSADVLSGNLEGTVGVGFFSWGEEIRITVSEISHVRSKVTISSASRIRSTAWDHGKNRKNIEALLEGISRILDRSSAAPPPGREISSMSDRESEAQAELKPLGQLLAQGKISPEEFESAKAKILAAKESMPCPACGASNPLTAGVCFNCGGLLRGEKYVCPDCGADLPSGDAGACPACGAKFAGARKTPDRIFAGFWARLGAAIIDGMLVGIVVILVSTLAAFVLSAPSSASAQSVSSTMFSTSLVIGFFISWIYYAYLESSPGQATLGKRVIKTKVTDLEGRRISFKRASARWLAKFLSIATFGLGFLLIGFTEKKQGLHDKVAGTLVRYQEKTG
ncbi:MAG: RDD family protein [Methanomicrobiales archaeon]|jgi:uncharacterized RDD family membrane protein YckC/ribosomal protein L40E